MITTISTMMNEVSSPVHFILQRTAVINIRQSPLSVLLFADRHLPPHIGAIVIIQPTTYFRMILTIAHSLTPRLVQNLHYVPDMTAALHIIH
ncbi:MAG: hypothetical protein KC496_02060, partial [Anaerolineae bacterium]|nr:hypothetical protein [Anaerolineae bacterium]